MDDWCKSLPPSDDLRRWFSHDPAKWKEFQRRYWSELADNPAPCEALLNAAKQGNITLLSDDLPVGMEFDALMGNVDNRCHWECCSRQLWARFRVQNIFQLSSAAN